MYKSEGKVDYIVRKGTY